MADIVAPPGAKGGPVLLRDMALQSPEDVDIRGGRIVRLREFAIQKGSIDNFTAAAATITALTLAGSLFTPSEYARLDGADFTGALTVNGDTVWHAGNDGAGSGLDADYLRTYAPSSSGTASTIALRTATGALVAGGTGGDLNLTAGWVYRAAADQVLRVSADSTNGGFLDLFGSTYATVGYRDSFRLVSGGLYNLWGLNTGALSWSGASMTINGNAVWHAGNDGSGTGLDADTVDGSHASAFAAASHAHGGGDITSGTISAARLASSGSQTSASFLRGDGVWSNQIVGNFYATNLSAWNGSAFGFVEALYASFTQTTGSAPMFVSSTTVVSNLNADLLDGQHGSYYRDASNINAGVIGNAYVNWAAPSAIGTTTRADGYFKSVMIGDTGNYAAGSIYSDSNWGMLFRARVAGASADFMWANSAGTLEQLRIPSVGGIGIPDGQTIPTTVTGVAFIYVDTADGDLKVKFGDGTVKTIVAD